MPKKVNKTRREFLVERSKERIKKLKELNAPQDIIEIEQEWLEENISKSNSEIVTTKSKTFVIANGDNLDIIKDWIQEGLKTGSSTFKSVKVSIVDEKSTFEFESEVDIDG